jgi:hypothetical protein
MAQTIQSGANSNQKNYQDFGYWLNGIDVTQQNLDKFTPYIQGISRVFVYNPPIYMDNLFPDKTASFRTTIEAGFTRIQGIADLDVSFVDFEGGFAGQRYQTVGLVRDNTDSVTISVYELSGLPIREYLETWVSGVTDPRSGVAHYHGLLASGVLGEFSPKNHTMEVYYATLDPTATNLEYGCLFAHMFPRRVSKDHLNFEQGNRNNALIDMEFATTKYESPAINYVARYYVVASHIEYNYLAFTPGFVESKFLAPSYGSNNTLTPDGDGNYQTDTNNITGNSNWTVGSV